MMKKILVLIMLSFLIGCKSNLNDESTTSISSITEKTEYMVCLYKMDHYGMIVYDRRTGVQYWLSGGGYNAGNLSVLLDKDGKPLIYNGEKEERSE